MFFITVLVLHSVYPFSMIHVVNRVVCKVQIPLNVLHAIDHARYIPKTEVHKPDYKRQRCHCCVTMGSKNRTTTNRQILPTVRHYQIQGTGEVKGVLLRYKM